MQWKILSGVKELREHELQMSRRRLQEKYRTHVSTPFEHRMIGGTAYNVNYLHKRGDTLEDFHTPIIVLGSGKLRQEEASIAEANLVRGKLEFDTVSAFSLGYKDLDMTIFIAVSLEPLDPITGVTVTDPRILGVYDGKTDTIIQIPGRDLNKEYYQHLKDWAQEHPEDEDPLWKYVRDGQSYLEKEISVEPERK